MPGRRALRSVIEVNPEAPYVAATEPAQWLSPLALASIDIYCQERLRCGYALKSTRRCPMSSSLNVQLTDELRRYVDERASDKDVYATPSEYIRDLIRQDMQDRAVALNILEGMADLRHGRFSDKSILDLKEED
jgi:antitoxin ParD1/3/4